MWKDLLQTLFVIALPLISESQWHLEMRLEFAVVLHLHLESIFQPHRNTKQSPRPVTRGFKSPNLDLGGANYSSSQGTYPPHAISSTKQPETLPILSSTHFCYQPNMTTNPLKRSLATALSHSRTRNLPVAANQIRTHQQRHASTLRPLEGVTVVSLCQAIAAPYCSRQLADLGARVIKVERPGSGDFARDYDTRAGGLSSHFTWVNRGKESLALDLKDPKDLDVLKQILKGTGKLKADVLVQNLAPGASERLGLGWEMLSKENPGLIICDISGYGNDGPYKNKKAYDLLIQSESGVLSVTGDKGQPAKVGMSIADIAAGMYALTNILAALMERKQNGGVGRHIDISMLECMVEWMGFPMYYTYNGAPPPVPVGASHASIYPYGPFETSDGSVMLGIQNEREWVSFCEKVLKMPEIATDPRFETNAKRDVNRKELREIICEVFAKSNSDEVIALLEEGKIANAIVNDMAGVWAHPQLKARDRWTVIGTPVGELPALLPPGVPSSAKGERRSLGSIPKVGEHNEKILAELRS